MASQELLGGCPTSSLLALAEMLVGVPEEEEPPPSSESHAGPGSLGPPKAAPAAPAAIVQEKPGEHKGIWTTEELPEGSEYDDSWDTREQPEYEILFRQQVGAEDVFLGMSRKDPSTACCEDMLIKIKLPDTKASDIILDIREKVLDLRSPQSPLTQPNPAPYSSLLDMEAPQPRLTSHTLAKNSCGSLSLRMGTSKSLKSHLLDDKLFFHLEAHGHSFGHLHYVV